MSERWRADERRLRKPLKIFEGKTRVRLLPLRIRSQRNLFGVVLLILVFDPAFGKVRADALFAAAFRVLPAITAFHTITSGVACADRADLSAPPQGRPAQWFPLKKDQSMTARSAKAIRSRIFSMISTRTKFIPHLRRVRQNEPPSWGGRLTMGGNHEL